MTNFTKQFKKLYAGKGTANGGLMLALSPQFLKLDEINEIPIDTDFELKWTCSSKAGLVDVEIYLLNYLVNSYTDIDAQDKSATIKVEEGDAVMVGGTLRIVIKDKLGILEDEIEVEVVEADAGALDNIGIELITPFHDIPVSKTTDPMLGFEIDLPTPFHDIPVSKTTDPMLGFEIDLPTPFHDIPVSKTTDPMLGFEIDLTILTYIPED